MIHFRSMTPFKVNHFPVRMRATIKTSKGETVTVEPIGQKVHKYHPKSMTHYGDYVGILEAWKENGERLTTTPPFPYTKKGILRAINATTGRDFKDFTFNERDWIENEL